MGREDWTGGSRGGVGVREGGLWLSLDVDREAAFGDELETGTGSLVGKDFLAMLEAEIAR